MKQLFICSLIACLCWPVGSSAHHSLTPAQKQFAHQIAKLDHFNEQEVLNWLAKSNPSKRILYDSKHPKEDASWDLYRSLFINEQNINQGVAYYKKHQKVLRAAYQRYGVDPLAIVAIVGMESHFGMHQGKHQAAIVLNTLAFYGRPERQSLFQKQLRSLFLLSRKLGADPLTFKSSYSGALGKPQFMPTTYLNYAASPDATKKLPDLFKQDEDAIFSVANYLAKAGWVKDQAIAVKTEQQQNTLHYAENGKNKQWNKSTNFKAVHRYNQSNKYVLAVSELANEIGRHL